MKKHPQGESARKAKMRAVEKNDPMLRRADNFAKIRILLEATTEDDTYGYSHISVDGERIAEKKRNI